MNPDDRPAFVRYLDHAFAGALFLLAFAAPLSIAGTQIAWSFALLFWIIRLFYKRPGLRREGIDLAMLAFVGLTALSSVFSYEQEVSVRKLVSVSLVTIVYLVSEYISDRKMLRRLVCVLLIGGGVSVAYTFGTFAIGKNLKLVALTEDSPLKHAGIESGDTVLTANGQKIETLDQFGTAMAGTPAADGTVVVKVYRHELLIDYPVTVTGIAPTGDIASRFGIVESARGRDTRAAGFFGHYTTYAEALQLIIALVFGLLIVLPGRLFTRERLLLAAAALAFTGALILTVTRASWAGLLIAVSVMVLIGTSKRTVLICVACAIPVVLGGIYFLQQKRNVAFIDTNDGSTTWRMTVWREGLGLLASNPRHLAVGVGMDSIKTHYMEWHLFDDGRLPIGHMHSTPIELALERGVPTFIAWAAWMLIYLSMLWRGFRQKGLEWFERGVLLGAFGGTIGFLSSGLVHYNWGDSEVAMIFYLVMGFSLAILRGNAATPAQIPAEV